jgi:trans-aconitate 2-methyltransferase
MTWSAQQYILFEDERTRPVRDLAAQIQVPKPQHVADIGCGPGNSTAVLCAQFPAATMLGIDSSEDMVAAARKRIPNGLFEVADITSWRPPHTFDVILANAVLHWVPDHRSLLPRLLSYLNDGGHLAIQMPDNRTEPTHILMRETANSGPWAGKLKDAGERTQVMAPPWYYALLRPLCTRVEVWRTIYHHPLRGVEGIVEWFKGSALRPFLQPLDEPEREAYLEHYATLLGQHYRADAQGTVLLPFPRLFVVAVRE